MLKRNLIVTAVLLLGTGGLSAEPVKMDGSAIMRALSGKSVAGNQDGRKWRQEFMADGATVYYEGNQPSPGRWKVDGDQYCSLWPPSEKWDCYDMAMDGEEILFMPKGSAVWRAHFTD